VARATCFHLDRMLQMEDQKRRISGGGEAVVASDVVEAADDKAVFQNTSTAQPPTP
jgi:hypothetical protein